MENIKVRIAEDLEHSSTRYKYKLDGSGYMKGMSGKVVDLGMSIKCFREEYGDAVDIFCKQADRKFTFSKEDLKLVSDLPLQPLPEPETFNPKHLDI